MEVTISNQNKKSLPIVVGQQSFHLLTVTLSKEKIAKEKNAEEKNAGIKTANIGQICIL